METRTVELTGIATSSAEGPARGLGLVVDDGPDRGRSVSVGIRTVKIGAGDVCDLVLSDRAVSRVHVEVRAVRGGLVVKDAGSTNGTFVGGARILEAKLAAGGSVVVGETKLVVIEEAAARIEPSERTRFGGLLGQSRSMREVFAVLELAAPTDATVLVEGPSGTGKELAARALHDHSKRASKSFVAFDCGAVQRDLLASSLVGHKKGAFTGAERDRAGAFVEANGGTLFLDEVGELPLESQTHLLRALESRQVTPVGADRPRDVDVRVVAATHRDLFHMVESGSFRLDLFHRLAVVHVKIPALSARSDDIALLVRGFYEGRGLDPGPIEGANLDALCAHNFAGNVRELRNILERSWVLAGDRGARFADLKLWLGATTNANKSAFDVDVTVPFKEAKDAVLAKFERAYLAALIAKHPDNVTRAAEAAGISRRHLHTLLVEHGLARDDG
jgi:DNA-binding NtrC family response regulator